LLHASVAPEAVLETYMTHPRLCGISLVGFLCLGVRRHDRGTNGLSGLVKSNGCIRP
jgi:hypothetical protein